MKTRLSALLLVTLSLAGTASSAFAASKKADDRTAALVAALQAVSPDPLGGRLGLAATTARPAGEVANANEARGKTAENSRAEQDRRAYLSWKNAQKS